MGTTTTNEEGAAQAPLDVKLLRGSAKGVTRYFVMVDGDTIGYVDQRRSEAGRPYWKAYVTRSGAVADSEVNSGETTLANAVMALLVAKNAGTYEQRRAWRDSKPDRSRGAR